MVADMIAVVLVVHNGGDRLRCQIKSMCMQSELPGRVYLVDDSSTDGSVAEAVDRLSSVGVAVQTVRAGKSRNTSTRIAQNFENGIRAASEDARWIALADQDDLWLPNRLSRQRFRLSQTGALLTCGRVEAFRESDESIVGDLSWTFPVGVEVSEWYKLGFSERLHSTVTFPSVTGAATMLDSDLVQLASPFSALWLHDRWLALVAASEDRLDHDPETVIKYRVHDGQVVGTSGARRRFGFRDLGRDVMRQSILFRRFGPSVLRKGGNLHDLVPSLAARGTGRLR
jgi:Glycosyltransferases involved in cell wall biogenesis